MERKTFYHNVITVVCILAFTGCSVPETEELSTEEPKITEEPLGAVEESEPMTLPEPLHELADELRAEGCTFNAYRMGWVLDWADAGNIVDTVFGPGSDFQNTFWEITYPDQADQFRDIAYRAYREVDFKARAEMWQEAERIIADDVVMVLPLNYLERIILINTDVNYLLPPFGGPRVADWSSKTGKTTLVFPLGVDPPTLDTTLGTDVVSFLAIDQMTDTPYKFTEDGSIEPLAATGFEVSEEGTVYTVHLREDAVWSDGVPVTAQHFVDGVLRLLDPNMANAYAYVMMGIEGAPAYASGEASTLDSITVVDDFTFQFRLSEPLSYFDSLLAFSVFNPIRKDVIETNPDSYTRPGVMVSNGAYLLSEYVLGSHLLFEKNPLYWDAGNVTYDRIEMPIIPETATCVAAFEAGDIDITFCGIPSEDSPRWVNRAEFVRAPWPGLSYLAFNLLSDHTDDLDFRKALSYSIDRRTWNDVVLEAPWKVEARGVIPPEIYGYQGDAVGFEFDADKAREHLESYMSRAGISDPGEITIELWIPGGDSSYEAIQVMWEQNLGIEVQIISMEWQTYVDTLGTCQGVAEE